MKKISEKLIVIMGPTASGKSDLAIALARKYNGEIISADSRQVYRGLDIGTGKVTRTEQKLAKHHLLDVASPKRTYNVTHFVRDAKKAIQDIEKRGKLPILCGGTGFWIQTLLEEKTFPQVKPDPVLRKRLAKLSTEALFKQLKQKDPVRAKTIDAQNKVRLIRALEICATLGTVPPITPSPLLLSDTLILALNPPKAVLEERIALRLEKRLRQGMLAEVKRLRREGLSFQRLESFGLEYRFLALFLQKKISRETMIERLNLEIRHYAKRQLTWLRRFEKMGAPIRWISDPKEGAQFL